MRPFLRPPANGLRRSEWSDVSVPPPLPLVSVMLPELVSRR
jgi:hypothetical protein